MIWRKMGCLKRETTAVQQKIDQPTSLTQTSHQVRDSKFLFFFFLEFIPVQSLSNKNMFLLKRLKLLILLRLFVLVLRQSFRGGCSGSAALGTADSSSLPLSNNLPRPLHSSGPDHRGERP